MSSSTISYANAAANGSAEASPAAAPSLSTAKESSPEAVESSEVPESPVAPSTTAATATGASETSKSTAAAPAKKKKKALAPAPVPTESVWGIPVAAATATEEVSASGDISSAEIDESKWPTPQKYPQLAEAANASSSSKSSLQKFIKPITNKWVPITAKVSLPNPRNNSNANNSNNNSSNNNNNQQRQNKKNKNKNKNSTLTASNPNGPQSNGSVKKQASQQSLSKKVQGVDSSEIVVSADPSGEFASLSLAPDSVDSVDSTGESLDAASDSSTATSSIATENNDDGSAALSGDKYQQHAYRPQQNKNFKGQGQQVYGYHNEGYDNRQRYHPTGSVPNSSGNNGMQRNYRRYNNNNGAVVGGQQYRQNYYNPQGQVLQAPIDQQTSLQQQQSIPHAYHQNGFYHPQPYVQPQGYQYNNRQYRHQNGQYRPQMNNRNNYRNNGGYRQMNGVGHNDPLNAYLPFQPQIPPPISPKQDPQQALIQQIDYYFSLENLLRDIFLRKNMDEEGWVPLRLILEFKRVKIIVNGIQNSSAESDESSDKQILESVKKCENVEFKYAVEDAASIDDVKLRVKENFEQWLLPVETN